MAGGYDAVSSDDHGAGGGAVLGGHGGCEQESDADANRKVHATPGHGYCKGQATGFSSSES